MIITVIKTYSSNKLVLGEKVPEKFHVLSVEKRYLDIEKPIILVFPYLPNN